MELIPILIFLLTFTLIFTEVVSKTLIALIGASLMVFYGVVRLEELSSIIDFEILGIIFGIMIIVEIIKRIGLFQFLSIKVIKLANNDIKILFISFLFLTTLISVFMSNIASMLIVSALTFTLCRRLKIDPIPFLISEAIVTNIGGITLLISSVPNILVGEAANLAFIDFIKISVPLAAILFVITVFILLHIYNKKLEQDAKIKIETLDEWSVVPDKELFWKVTIVFILTLFLFLIADELNIRRSVISVSSAIILCLISGKDIDETLKTIDWGLIFFLGGLFIVINGLEKSDILNTIATYLVNFCLLYTSPSPRD